MEEPRLRRIVRDEVERLTTRLDSYELFHQAGMKPSDFYYDGYVGGTNVDRNWTDSGFINAAGNWLMAYSKKTWLYPSLAFECIWPNIATANLVAIVEFESGGRGLINRNGFRMLGGNFYLSGGSGERRVNLNVAPFLPGTYDSATHRYGLKLNKCNLEGYINDSLAGIILFGLPEAIPAWEAVPYSIRSTQSILISMRTPFGILLEPSGAIPSTTLGISWGNDQCVCNDGDPLPPRQYALYNENTATKWNGQATAVALTSHPVPVWGYERKTLFFQSNAAGTLKVQIYAGGAWRDYASPTVGANTLVIYSLSSETPIARCVYTPVGTDTIAVGEWYLG